MPPACHSPNHCIARFSVPIRLDVCQTMLPNSTKRVGPPYAGKRLLGRCAAPLACTDPLITGAVPFPAGLVVVLNTEAFKKPNRGPNQAGPTTPERFKDATEEFAFPVVALKFVPFEPGTAALFRKRRLEAGGW